MAPQWVRQVESSPSLPRTTPGFPSISVAQREKRASRRSGNPPGAGTICWAILILDGQKNHSTQRVPVRGPEVDDGPNPPEIWTILVASLVIVADG